MYAADLPIHDKLTTAEKAIDISDIGRLFILYAKLAASIYPQVLEYRGPLYFGLALRLVEGQDLSFRTDGEGGGMFIQRTPQTAVKTWLTDDFGFAVGDDPYPVARRLAKALFRRAGYSGYETYVESWYGPRVQTTSAPYL